MYTYGSRKLNPGKGERVRRLHAKYFIRKNKIAMRNWLLAAFLEEAIPPNYSVFLYLPSFNDKEGELISLRFDIYRKRYLIR